MVTRCGGYHHVLVLVLVVHGEKQGKTFENRKDTVNGHFIFLKEGSEETRESEKIFIGFEEILNTTGKTLMKDTGSQLLLNLSKKFKSGDEFFEVVGVEKRFLKDGVMTGPKKDVLPGLMRMGLFTRKARKRKPLDHFLTEVVVH